MLINTPGFLRFVFPDALWSKPSVGQGSKNVYLTFDDGPTPSVTDWVLDFLYKHNISASFFCVGKNIEQNSLLFDRIVREGHAVGNHTYSHANGWKTRHNNYLADVERCDQFFQKKIFRPPYGKLTFGQYASLKKNYQIVFWDVITYDYRQDIAASQCLDNIRRSVKDGSIIVFHDSIKAEKNLKAVLPETINFLKEEGYRFSTL